MRTRHPRRGVWSPWVTTIGLRLVGLSGRGRRLPPHAGRPCHDGGLSRLARGGCPHSSGLELLRTVHEDGCQPFPASTSCRSLTRRRLTLWLSNHGRSASDPERFPKRHVGLLHHGGAGNGLTDSVHLTADRLCETADHVLFKVYRAITTTSSRLRTAITSTGWWTASPQHTRRRLSDTVGFLHAAMPL